MTIIMMTNRAKKSNNILGKILAMLRLQHKGLPMFKNIYKSTRHIKNPIFDMKKLCE